MSDSYNIHRIANYKPLTLAVILLSAGFSSNAAIIDTLVSTDVATYTSGVIVQHDTASDNTFAYAEADFGAGTSSIDSLFYVDNVTGSTIDMFFDGNLYVRSTGGSSMNTPGYPPQNFAMVHYHANADSIMTFDWTVNYPRTFGGTDVLHFYLYETDGALPIILEGASYATPGWRQIGYGGASLQYNTTYTGQGSAQLIAGKNYAFAIWHNLNLGGGVYGTSLHYGMEGAVSVDFGVNTVPIPATVWLFSSGLMGLIGVIGRKKQCD